MTSADEITFRSDVTVELVRSSASDADVVFAARVSTSGEQSLEDIDADAERSTGLINYLMRDRHGSPFEHNSMTFFVRAPIFVWREHMRHRIASYNEESGRYRQLEPVFYVPDRQRPVIQVGKTGAYEFLPGTDEQYDLIDHDMREACSACLRRLPAHARRRHRPRGGAHGAARVDLLQRLRDLERPVADELPLAAAEGRRDRTSPPTPNARSRWSRSGTRRSGRALMPITHAAFVQERTSRALTVLAAG